MKRKQIIIGFMAMILLTLCTATPAFASTCEGQIDGVRSNAIYGWAWNSTTPDSPVQVRIVVKKEETSEIVLDTTTSAGLHRNDLANSGKGNGEHAFIVNVDWSKLEDCAYIIEGYVEDLPLENTICYQSGQATPVKESNLISLGSFKTTAYCPCHICSEGWGRQTSTGALATANHTIAVDPKVIPYGSQILINDTIYTAEDRGGAVKGNHIDIYFNTHGETYQYGKRNVEVFLVP